MKKKEAQKRTKNRNFLLFFQKRLKKILDIAVEHDLLSSYF